MTDSTWRTLRLRWYRIVSEDGECEAVQICGRRRYLLPVTPAEHAQLQEELLPLERFSMGSLGEDHAWEMNTLIPIPNHVMDDWPIAVVRT
jgi:hypothetical protein